MASQFIELPVVLGGGYVISVNTLTGIVVLTKSNIGLSNVDDTSDSSKPVSIAQQAAINNKVGDVIVNGVTTIAPSQNAVFDALALKQNNLGFTPENQANKTTVILANLDNVQYPTTQASYNFVAKHTPYYHIQDPKFFPVGPGVIGETIVSFYSVPSFLEKFDTLRIHSIICRRLVGNNKIYFRLRHSELSDYATSVIIATTEIDSVNEISTMQRTFTNNGNSISGIEFNYPTNSDVIQHSVFNSITFDYSQPVNFWVTAEIFDIDDSCEIGGIKIGV